MTLKLNQKHNRAHSTGVFDALSIILLSSNRKELFFAAGENHHVEQLLRAAADQIITCLIWPACCFVVYRQPEVNKSLENNLYPTALTWVSRLCPLKYFHDQSAYFVRRSFRNHYQGRKLKPSKWLICVWWLLVWPILQVTLARKPIFVVTLSGSQYNDPIKYQVSKGP